VADSSFEEIWRSGKYQAFREMCVNIPKKRRPVPGCDCFTVILRKTTKPFTEYFDLSADNL
jgi:hypothetical protein